MRLQAGTLEQEKCSYSTEGLYVQTLSLPYHISRENDLDTSTYARTYTCRPYRSNLTTCSLVPRSIFSNRFATQPYSGFVTALPPIRPAPVLAPTLAAFCEKHLPVCDHDYMRYYSLTYSHPQREQAEARLAALSTSPAPDAGDGAQSSKTARAYAKTYKPGPPLVPRIIVERLREIRGKYDPDNVMGLAGGWKF